MTPEARAKTIEITGVCCECGMNTVIPDAPAICEPHQQAIDAIRTAVAEEREACAKVADPVGGVYDIIRSFIAAEIRAPGREYGD